jgi:hypothetical protein
VVELLLTQKIHSISQETSCFDANERQGAKGWEEQAEHTLKKSNIAIVLICIRGVSSGPIAGVDLKSLGRLT